MTKEQFKDFELELEFMIDEHGKYNSGVYLRNDPGKGGRTGYQVNIGRGQAEEYTAGIFTDHWLAKGGRARQDPQDAATGTACRSSPRAGTSSCISTASRSPTSTTRARRSGFSSPASSPCRPTGAGTRRLGEVPQSADSKH